jgi:N-acetylneuraminic acid mutarotase
VQTVTISDATPGVTIYYTTNGTTPLTSSTVYSGPITVSSNETLEAFAVATGYSNSAVATAAYTINVVLTQAATPTFSPAGGSYSSAQTVSISDTTPGAIIYYTTNGTTPTTASIAYTSAITVASTETVEAIATASDYSTSAAASAAYTITSSGPSSSGAWAWVAGNSTSGSSGGQPSVYGTQGVPAATNGPGGRQDVASWIDSSGHLWLFGGTLNSGSYLNDLWEFNASTSEWTWVGGSSEENQKGAYGTMGTPAGGNIPGSRSDASTWTDASGNLWLFGGTGYDSNGIIGSLNDLWEFNPTTGQWAWMSGVDTLPCAQCAEYGAYGTMGTPAAGNAPGGRNQAVTWTDKSGNFWLFGGFGADSNDALGYLNDLWEFKPSTKEWTWIAGNSTLPNKSGTSGQSGVYGTMGTSAGGNVPGGREYSSSWTDSSGNLWLFGGNGFDATGGFSFLNDLWKFSPSTGQWTWMDGSETIYQIGAYGGLGIPAASNIPGSRYAASSWADSSGNLWLFGGYGYGGSSSGAGYLNDLWEYIPSKNQWAWMGGVSAIDHQGTYGTQGTAVSINVAGSRWGAASWTTSSGNFFLFGGDGFDSNDTLGLLNDLWEYKPSATSSLPPAATPTFSPATGTYTSAQTVTISDATAGATIYVTLNGTTPTTSSAVYTGPITVSSTETIEAFATANGSSASAVATAAYTIGTAQTASPAFSPAAGTYSSAQTVTISDATAGATIYYTTNGTTPTTSSNVYSGPITVAATETIEAFATAGGDTPSAVVSAIYTIPPTFSIAASPASLTLNSGSSGTITVTVTPAGGFDAAVSFACTGQPAGASCSFSPATVTPPGSTSTTLTVTAPASSAALHRNSGSLFPEALLAAAVCCFGWRKRRRLQLFALLAAGAIGLSLITACGGSSSGGGSSGGGGGTQPVTSTVTVTATSASLQETTTFTLTVN